MQYWHKIPGSQPTEPNWKFSWMYKHNIYGKMAQQNSWQNMYISINAVETNRPPDIKI